MAGSVFNDPMAYEHILYLPNNRQLHYTHAGNTSSKLVVLFFSGTLSVGNASNSTLPTPLVEAGVHYIAPTLPGNGESSSTPEGVPYHVNLCRTINALLDHLHPTNESNCNAMEHLLIGGGSYGSVPAQMLYGAPFDLFPHGKRIAGMIAVGPPSQWIPFRVVSRLLSTFLAARCKSVADAKGLLDTVLFSKMDPPEKEQFSTFAREKRRMTSEQFMESMAESVVKCAKNWDGFIEGPDVLHSDWGFEPAKLDEEHANERRPVLIVQGDDDELGSGMVQWLVESYSHASLMSIEGGHLASLYCMDQIWTEMLLLSGMQSASGMTDE